jgi:hypothetical protein
VAKSRTYAFRAPGDLAERLERARQLLAVPDDGDVDVAALVAREFEQRLGDLRDSGEPITTQSELIRAAIELVAGAAAKVADDLYWADLYALEPPREWEDPEWLAAVVRGRSSAA